MPTALLANNDVVQVNVVSRFDGQVVMNTFHYFVNPSGGTGVTDVSRVLTKFESQIWEESLVGAGDGLAYMMMPGVDLCTATGQRVFGTGGRSRLESYTLTPNLGQWATGNPLPTGACAVVKRTGALAGRQYQGRVYIPGIPQVGVTDSVLTPTYAGKLALWAVRAEADMTVPGTPASVTLRPCLWNGAGAPLAGQIGLDYDVTYPVRYQRRREVGVGI